MAGLVRDDLDEINKAAGRRQRHVDPLLAEPGDPPGCCPKVLIAPGQNGNPAGFAVCSQQSVPADSLAQTWGMATKFALAPRLREPDTLAMHALLAQWRDHLSGLPEARVDDTAAVVTWPSRDATVVPALLRHGLQPMAVIAARPKGRATPAAPVPGVVIRQAEDGDIEALSEMHMALIVYDAQFGGSVPRPATEALVLEDVRATVAREPSWTWLAERDRRPVGMVAVQPPREAAWIAGMTRAAPAAYLQAGYVVPGERGSGAAGMLTRHVHDFLDAEGIAVTLLHYAQVNPLSGPFWTRMGYRPLWVSWEARPAAALR
jgi:GNAT superfamily N-acetyltransferase